MASMSSSDCFVSRYTVPRKLSGSDSWNKSPFMSTTSPTVMVPACTPRAASTMATERAAEKITLWPQFSADRLACVCTLAASTPCRQAS
jgi:hypothetical protein